MSWVTKIHQRTEVPKGDPTISFAVEASYRAGGRSGVADPSKYKIRASEVCVFWKAHARGPLPGDEDIKITRASVAIQHTFSFFLNRDQ